MAALRQWVHTGPNLRLRFLVGPGGAGKTRLAAELAEALNESGWFAGFAALEDGATLPFSQRGLLVILDYPEASPGTVRTLLREAARIKEPKAPIRLLLLSRRPLSDWRDDIIQAGATSICDEQEVNIGPLDESAAISVFQQASARLTQHRGLRRRQVTDAAVGDWLRRCPEVHALPLLVTASAIHFVDEPSDSLGLGLPAGGVVAALVNRERKRLDLAASGYGWGEHAASQLVGMAVLRDWVSASAVRRIAKEIGLPSPDGAVRVLRRLGWWEDRHLRAPQPDIVAAELLRQVLYDAGDRTAEWIWAALADKEAVRPELIGRRMYDIALLHGPAEHRLSDAFIAAVAGRLDRARVWKAFHDSDHVDFRISPLAVAVAQALLSEPSLNDEERASLLHNLSANLSEAGDRAGALAASREAVEIRRRLASERAVPFERDLSASLTDLSTRLAEIGDAAASLEASREAVEIARRSAQSKPVLLEDLSASLISLSLAAARVGDSTVALATAREAIAIDRELAKESPARFEPSLAADLNNLANRLGEAGNDKEALEAMREAAAMYRRLAQANPAYFEPNLAMALINLSVWLADAGDAAGGLASIRDAVVLLRRLTEENPARFEPLLTIGLYNLSQQSAEGGDGAGALTSIREAAEMDRRLAQTNPTRFEPQFAKCLHQLANQLAEAHDAAGALASIREAVEIYSRLALGNPAGFEPNLALGLVTLSARLAAVSDGANAVDAIRRAVKILLRLAQENPTRFEPDLANSLAHLADRLTERRDNAGALVARRAALEIYRPLAQSNPTRFEIELAVNLHHLSLNLSEYGDIAGASAAIREALKIYNGLAKTDPARFSGYIEHCKKRLSELEASGHA